MGIFDGSAGSGGSTAQSWSQSDSVSDARSHSESWNASQSQSATYGTEASQVSAMQAEIAHQRQLELMRESELYNAIEAQKQRDFQELMANTLYTRSVKNMREAGINPILAYNNGLSGAAVNSGAAANISAPSTFMGQTFADQRSASASAGGSFSDYASHSESHSRSSSESHSWNNSMSGLATALENMGKFVGAGLSSINAATTLNLAIPELKNATKDFEKNINEINSIEDSWQGYRNKVTGNLKKEVGNNNFLKWLNNLQIKAVYGK